MKTTTNKLTVALGVDRPSASNLLQGLAAIKQASIVGKEEKPVGQKGRASNIFELTDEATKFLGLEEK